ncbi:MAG: hypothetical protein ABGZ35_09380, partial [Planctomycetaceae bacterium]
MSVPNLVIAMQKWRGRWARNANPAGRTGQRGREVSVGKLQCFGEELLVPSGALSLSLEAV